MTDAAPISHKVELNGCALPVWEWEVATAIRDWLQAGAGSQFTPASAGTRP
jgi:hypothetical protein